MELNETNPFQTVKIENRLLKLVMSAMLNSPEDLVKDSTKNNLTVEEANGAKKPLYEECKDVVGVCLDGKGADDD